MSQNYTRLTLQERFKIEKYLDQKLSISSIAVLLNRNKSTISREVKNSKKGVMMLLFHIKLPLKFQLIKTMEEAKF